jgi:hypothetical protein
MFRMSRALVAIALVLIAGCARHGARVSQTAVERPAPMAHVDVHGAIRLTRDLAVKECFVGKPGTHLLNGYSVTLAGDGVIESGEVLIPEFTGDGTYVEAAAKRQGISGVLSWIILNVARGPGFPHGTTLEERPDTRVMVTIGGGGKNGSARFENYRSLYGVNGDERGGVVWGSISWTCAQVAHPAL